MTALPAEQRANEQGATAPNGRSEAVDGGAPDSLIGVHDCGCVTAWCSLDHSTKREIAKFYSDMAKTGREVRRVRLDDVRERLERLGCKHRERGGS